MSENAVREKLAEIDRLRAEANLCAKMHTHWMGHDGELVEIQPVTVRRRWRDGKQLHSERVMTRAETRLFITWLASRASKLHAEANTLAAALGGGDHE